MNKKLRYPKEFITEGIRMLMTKNYKLPSDSLDLEALVDSNLTFKENWSKLKPKVMMLNYISLSSIERDFSHAGSFYRIDDD